MQKHDGERTIEQQHDLPRELHGVADACRCKGDAQPVFELLLVRGADLDRRMPGQIGQLGRGAQKAAALPFRMPRRAGEVAEDAFHLVKRARLRCRRTIA